MQFMQGSVGKLVLEVIDDPLYVALWPSITRNQAHTPSKSLRKAVVTRLLYQQKLSRLN